MKVIKFGGSSLASASQLQKVLAIVKADADRRFVVVSAPGKRDEADTKVTDALIKYYKAYVAGQDVSLEQNWIINRYKSMIEELGLSDSILTPIAQAVTDLTKLPIKGNAFLYDTFLAAGEDNNAKLITAYFQANGLNALYIHPKDAGIIVSSDPAHQQQ